MTDGLPKDENCLTIRKAADRYWNWLFKAANNESLKRSSRAFITKRTRSEGHINHMRITLNADKCEEYPTPTSSESYRLGFDRMRVL